jgi:hypothetical protein
MYALEGHHTVDSATVHTKEAGSDAEQECLVWYKEID